MVNSEYNIGDMLLLENADYHKMQAQVIDKYKSHDIYKYVVQHETGALQTYTQKQLDELVKVVW